MLTAHLLGKSDDKPTLMIKALLGYWGEASYLTTVAVYASFQFSPWPSVLHSRLVAHRQARAQFLRGGAVRPLGGEPVLQVLLRGSGVPRRHLVARRRRAGASS